MSSVALCVSDRDSVSSMVAVKEDSWTDRPIKEGMQDGKTSVDG